MVTIVSIQRQYFIKNVKSHNAYSGYYISLAISSFNKKEGALKSLSEWHRGCERLFECIQNSSRIVKYEHRTDIPSNMCQVGEVSLLDGIEISVFVGSGT